MFHHQVQRLSVKVILFMCRQYSEESMLVKSALQGHLYCENANISQQHMLCGHKSFHSGSFDGAGGLGISTADGFQKMFTAHCRALCGGG